MGFRATHQFAQEFTNSKRIIVNHNLDVEYPGVRVLIDGEPSPEKILGVLVDEDDPTNTLVVALRAVYTGIVQITNFDIQPPGVQSSTLLALTGQGAKLVFGDNYQYEEDLTRSTVTGTTDFSQKLRITTPTIPTGTYRVAVSFTWDYSSASNNFIARAQLNDATTLWEMVEEPTDTAITQKRFAGAKYEALLFEGIHFFDLDFATGNAAQTAGIDQARMEFWRI